MELKQNSVPEYVMLKLQKLKVLAERGEAGEAENAKNLLKSLCEKYGIDEEKLFEEEKHCYEFEVRASVRNLFLQLYTSIYGTSERYMNEVTFWKKVLNVLLNVGLLMLNILSSVNCGTGTGKIFLKSVNE